MEGLFEFIVSIERAKELMEWPHAGPITAGGAESTLPTGLLSAKNSDDDHI